MGQNSKIGIDAGAARCRVLIVDDDAASLEEYIEIATSVGYRCEIAANAATALQLIADNADIGIVVTDLHMPTMDGLSLLDELSSRFASVRPLVPIVITGYGSLDAAVQAMRFNAKDFLSKPVSAEAFTAALRRASRGWSQLYGAFRLMALTPEPAPEAARVGQPAVPPVPLTPEEEREAMLAQVRNMVRMRERRGDFLDRQLFSDPAWDILLDLTSARLEGKSVPVSSACASTNLPLSTALRHVRNLVEEGLIRRWNDPEDRRRDLLALEDKTMDAMVRYLADMQRRHGAMS